MGDWLLWTSMSAADAFEALWTGYELFVGLSELLTIVAGVQVGLCFGEYLT